MNEGGREKVQSGCYTAVMSVVMSHESLYFANDFGHDADLRIVSSFRYRIGNRFLSDQCSVLIA